MNSLVLAAPIPVKDKNWEIFKWKIKNFFTQRWKEYPLEALLLVCKGLSKIIPGFNVPAHGRLYLKKINRFTLQEINFGHVGVHLITTVGKNYVAGCFDNTNEAENLKYHGYGTGTTAANVADTTLETELTTEYAGNIRPTGSQAKSTNTYTTIATLSPDSGGTLAITEWGLLSANATGTLYDRQVFAAVNVVASADSLQTTYTLTLG